MNWQELPHTEIFKEVGRKLKAMRVAQNYSQTELAQAAGLGRTTIIRMEKGESISFDALVRIFRVFHELNRFEDLFESPETSPLDMYLNKK